MLNLDTRFVAQEVRKRKSASELYGATYDPHHTRRPLLRQDSDDRSTIDSRLDKNPKEKGPICTTYDQIIRKTETLADLIP